MTKMWAVFTYFDWSQSFTFNGIFDDIDKATNASLKGHHENHKKKVDALTGEIEFKSEIQEYLALKKTVFYSTVRLIEVNTEYEMSF